MSAGFEIEHLARCEQQYREAVVYPAVARRAQQEVELQILRQSRPATRSSPVRRLGTWVMRFGARQGTASATPTAPRA